MAERDDAIDELSRRVQAGIEPTLDTDDLESIIDSTEVRRAYRWTANTPYLAGTVILPDNGYAFTVVQPGTSGASEPSWNASAVSDGGVMYERSEATFTTVYDMRTAVSKGWALKLAKAVEYMKSEDGDEYAIYEHVKEMADRYRRPLVA